MGLLRRAVAVSMLAVLVSACASSTPAPSPAPTLSSALPLSEDGVVGDLYCPDGPGPYVAVILLGGSEGGSRWSANTLHVQRLLDAGDCALSLAYFGLPGLPAQLREIPLEYFENALAMLAHGPRIVPDRYAIVGGSRGGELALLLASRYPEIKAVVAISPASVLFPSPPSDPLDALRAQHPAWAYKGEALPYLHIQTTPTAIRAMASGKQLEMFEEALRDEKAADAAAIPVEKAHGPILLISSTLDEVWPSTAMSERMMARLSASSFPYSYRHIQYVNAHNWCGLEPCWSEALSFLAESLPLRVTFSP